MAVHRIFIVGFVVALGIACAQPSATPPASGASKTPTASGTTTATGTDAEKDDDVLGGATGDAKGCIKGDMIKPKFWKAVDDCLAQQRLPFIEEGACTDAQFITGACNFQSMTALITQVLGGPPTAAFQKASQDGTKIVACGTVAGRDRDVAVVIMMEPAQDGSFLCDYPESVAKSEDLTLPKVKTGCYQAFADESKVPPEPQNEAEAKALVRKCMSK